MPKMCSPTGLLILTRPASAIVSSLPRVLEAASRHVAKTLYIHLDPQAKTCLPEKTHPVTLYSHIISNIYSSSPSLCRDLDVRVLMAGFKSIADVPTSTQMPVNVVMLDQAKKGQELLDLKRRYKSYLSTGTNMVLLHDTEATEKNREVKENLEEDVSLLTSASTDQVYPSVVLGGTFDHIHTGHLILLSIALLRCSARLTCGVATGPLLKNKILSELICSVQERISLLRKLVTDLDPSVEYNIVPIEDPLGPTRSDPDMDMIVVSEETKKGVAAINEVRAKNGLKLLEGHIIPLVQDSLRQSTEEEGKVSSSSLRMRLLGTVLKEPTANPVIPSHPYVIGLTGSSASGKSSIARRLEGLGAGVVDCDKLGHEAYAAGTACCRQLVEVFGPDIVGKGGVIDRRTLGAKVFADKMALHQLNSIVWPEIWRLAEQRLDTLKSEGVSVVVMDAAVLLEAGWDKRCHQIWVCILRREEAITRIMKRDGKTREEAEQRVDRQMPAIERVARANVVLCTEWSGEYTQRQVEKAWGTLAAYLSIQSFSPKAQI